PNTPRPSQSGKSSSKGGSGNKSLKFLLPLKLKTATCPENPKILPYTTGLLSLTQVSLIRYLLLKLSDPSTTISNWERISSALKAFIFSSIPIKPTCPLSFLTNCSALFTLDIPTVFSL